MLIDHIFPLVTLGCNLFFIISDPRIGMQFAVTNLVLWTPILLIEHHKLKKQYEALEKTVRKVIGELNE